MGIAPGREGAGKSRCAIRGVREAVRIGEQQIEARVALRLRFQLLEKGCGFDRLSQPIRNQAAAAGRIRSSGLQIAIVRDDAEAALAVHRQPRTLREQVAARKDPGRVIP